MINPVTLWEMAGKRGRKMLAVLCGLIVIVLGFVFFGTSMRFLPFAAFVLASVLSMAAAAYWLWGLLAMRDNGVNRSGAIVAGALPPLLGLLLLDAFVLILRQSSGSGDAWASSVLLTYWPVGIFGMLAGAAAALATSEYVERRFTHLNVSGMEPPRRPDCDPCASSSSITTIASPTTSSISWASWAPT